jgi:hypothetical protein
MAPSPSFVIPSFIPLCPTHFPPEPLLFNAATILPVLLIFVQHADDFFSLHAAHEHGTAKLVERISFSPLVRLVLPAGPSALSLLRVWFSLWLAY